MNKRIDWVDVAKGIAMICVILVHVEEAFMPGTLVSLKIPMYTFHMPLFFFMSGYLFSTKANFGAFLKNKCRRILVPYFCLGILLVLFDTYWHGRNPFGDPWFNMDYFMGDFWALLMQRRYWTLWFIATLFWLSILFYAIVRFVKSEKIRAAVVVLLTVAGLGYYRLGGGPLFWNIDVCFTALPFFYAGYLCRTKDFINQKILGTGRKWVYLIGFVVVDIVCAMLNYKLSGGFLEFFNCQYGIEILTYICGFAGVFGIVIISDVCNWKPLRYIGINTMLLYAWHQTMLIPIVQEFYNRHDMFEDFVLSTGMYYGRVFLTTLVSVVVLCVMNEIICRLKLGFLVGK